jgi:hypothetical protein
MITKYMLTLSIPVAIKTAIRKAAEDDQRSVASLVAKVMSDYLKQNKYL